jgi:hypothetical protein
LSTGIARRFDSGPERTERRTMGLLEALQKYIDAEEAKDPEIIDGTNIKDVLDVVDLSIAHSPVIPFRAPDHVSPAESLRGAVEAIETEGGGYILRDRIKTAEHLQRTTTMGTDIHSIAQVQVDGKWRTVAVGIGGDPRSYNMFAMLADVRNGYGFAGIKTSDSFPVIHERRGLPSDLALNEDGDSLTIKSEDLLLSWDYGADALGSKVLKVQLVAPAQPMPLSGGGEQG